MNAVVEQPVEQRYAQLDRGPLPERDAPHGSDQDGKASNENMSNQTSPDPEARPAEPDRETRPQ